MRRRDDERVQMVLRDRPEGMYPLDIAEQAGIKAGHLWPTLAALERRGVVASEWGTPADNGMRRRVYWLVVR